MYRQDGGVIRYDITPRRWLDRKRRWLMRAFGTPKITKAVNLLARAADAKRRGREPQGLEPIIRRTGPVQEAWNPLFQDILGKDCPIEKALQFLEWVRDGLKTLVHRQKEKLRRYLNAPWLSAGAQMRI